MRSRPHHSVLDRTHQQITYITNARPRTLCTRYTNVVTQPQIPDQHLKFHIRMGPKVALSNINNTSSEKSPNNHRHHIHTYLPLLLNISNPNLTEPQDLTSIKTYNIMLTYSFVGGCVLDVGSFTTVIDLRILPLGSYGVVLGMDWLDAHQACIDFQHKIV